MDRLNKLLERIEEIRQEINRLAHRHSLTASNVLLLSQQLDRMLNTFNQLEALIKLSPGLSYRFPLGDVIITQGVLNVISEIDCLVALSRHHNADWGEVSKQDWQSNDDALEWGYRLISSYTSTDHVKFWVITEQDRSLTTLLLPDEY